METFTKRPIVIAIALFCCLLWGSAIPMIVLGYQQMNVSLSDPFQVILYAGMRFFIAAIMVFGFALATKENMRVNRQQFKKIFILGVLQTFAQHLFLFFSLKTIHPANGSILASFGIFFTVIFSHFLYQNDRLNVRKMIGVIVGISGIVILSGGGEGGFSPAGEGFMILAMLISAVASIYTKKLTVGIAPIVITAYQFLIGASLLVIVGLAFASDIQFTLTGTSAAILLYKGFISAAAFTLWSSLLKYNQVSKITVFQFSAPIFGVLVSFFFFGETLDTSRIGISLLFVATGILLINLEKKSKPVVR